MLRWQLYNDINSVMAAGKVGYNVYANIFFIGTNNRTQNTFLFMKFIVKRCQLALSTHPPDSWDNRSYTFNIRTICVTRAPLQEIPTMPCLLVINLIFHFVSPVYAIAK